MADLDKNKAVLFVLFAVAALLLLSYRPKSHDHENGEDVVEVDAPDGVDEDDDSDDEDVEDDKDEPTDKNKKDMKKKGKEGKKAHKKDKKNKKRKKGKKGKGKKGNKADKKKDDKKGKKKFKKKHQKPKADKKKKKKKKNKKDKKKAKKKATAEKGEKLVVHTTYGNNAISFPVVSNNKKFCKDTFPQAGNQCVLKQHRALKHCLRNPDCHSFTCRGNKFSSDSICFMRSMTWQEKEKGDAGWERVAMCAGGCTSYFLDDKEKALAIYRVNGKKFKNIEVVMEEF